MSETGDSTANLLEELRLERDGLEYRLDELFKRRSANDWKDDPILGQRQAMDEQAAAMAEYLKWLRVRIGMIA